MSSESELGKQELGRPELGRPERRRIVLGVSGGIAAYKAVELCRRLVDNGYFVTPVLTHSATRFVGAATFSALASEPARTKLFDDSRGNTSALTPIVHTRLGQEADLVLVAPATAHLLARYATGMADDLLTTTLLATRSPVIVCPAMHSEMWDHPAVQENLSILASRGVIVVPPAEGRLAGGDVGMGRLADIEAILERVEDVVGSGAASTRRELSGVRVLVSAGGTREPIDPVRFISNRSSGKQGHALAEEAYLRGAEVTLVTASRLGATEGVKVVPVETASEMEEAMMKEAPMADVVIMAAAVADFRVKTPRGEKIKRSDGTPEILLEPTPDILAKLVKCRRSGQVLVGFAAETSDVIERGHEKLVRKGVDILVVNDVSTPGAGFDHDTNAVSILGPGGVVHEVALATKRRVAGVILDRIALELNKRSKTMEKEASS